MHNGVQKLSNSLDCPIQVDSRGLGVLVFEKLKLHAEKIAQIDAQTGKTETYGDILRKSIHIAQMLKQKGITSQDMLALSMSNAMESCLAFIASLFLKSCIAIMNSSLEAKEYIHLLTLTKPRLIFCEKANEKNIKKALADSNLATEVVVMDPSILSCDSFCGCDVNSSRFKPEAVENIKETAFILFSSGTSGLPKAICLTHYGMMWQTMAIKHGHDASVLLEFASLAWISGVLCLLIAAVDGGTRVLGRNFDANMTLEIINKYQVTWTFFSAYLVNVLLSNCTFGKYDVGSLTSFSCGGSIIPRRSLLKLKELFPSAGIYYSYGLSETSGIITYFNPKTDKDIMGLKIGSSGFPGFGVKVKVVDLETREQLGKNKQGELCIAGEALMAGYYNNPEQNKKCFDEEGYFATGDVGYYDEDGYIYVVDRIKDIFKCKLSQIIPSELETVLLSHPLVSDAAVVGIPHPLDREHPLAVVVRTPGSQLTNHQLLDFFHGRVSEKNRLLGGIKFVERLPYNKTGKLLRNELRKFVLREK